MRILVLTDLSSAHSKKWINALIRQGIDVYVFGLTGIVQSEYPLLKSDHCFIEDMGGEISNKSDGNFSKVIYLKALPFIKKIIKKIKPDILHSYYASSYGLLGALMHFKPFIVSVWGSDVYAFPGKSFLHKNVLKYVFNRANFILSTSHIMAEEISLYTKNRIEVIPFGVDMSVFKKNKNRSIFSEDDIVIGTIKKLEKNYAIDVLIKAFKTLKDKYPKKSLKLLIVGGGIEERNLKNLVGALNIQDDVHFTGWVPYSKVNEYHNELDIAAYLSINESFGVSVLESFACGVPVVASDALGFKEIVRHGENGLIVEKNNVEQAVNAFEILLNDQEKRIQFGEAAIKYTSRCFNLVNNVKRTIELYNKIL